MIELSLLSLMDVDFGLVEYPECKFLDELLDIACSDIIDLVSILEAYYGLVGLVLVLYPSHDVLPNHAVQGSLV